MKWNPLKQQGGHLMEKELELLNDRLRQFDMFLADVQNIWEQIDINRKYLKEKNYILFNNYKQFYDSMFFKMEELHSILIDIEKLVHNLSFEYYLTYFGPYKEPYSKGKKFYDKTSRGKEAKRRIIFLFDAFLGQYISLADLVIKNCWEIVRENDPTMIEISSLGHLLDLLRKGEIDLTLPVVRDVKKYEIEFNEIKNYRNYVFHHGALPIDDVGERTTYGHNYTTLTIPDITWKQGNQYDLAYNYDDGHVEYGISLSSFTRDRYKKLLEFVKDCINIDRRVNK